MIEPIVSIVIPTYNSEKTLEKALRSVSEQTLQDIEIVLVDDASSDDTVNLARKILEAQGIPHKIIPLFENGGPAHARNAGVNAAKGKYIAFLDSDDIWFPKKLEKQVGLMESDPTITLCGCQAEWVNNHDEVIAQLYRNLPTVQDEGWKELLWNTFIATPCVMARRDSLGIAPFDLNLPIGEDRDLWIRLASLGRVGLIHDLCVRISLSENSYMQKHGALMETVTGPMIRKYLELFSERLSEAEKRTARGKLANQIGKYLCQDDLTYRKGVKYLIESIFSGVNIVDGFRTIILTSRLVKQIRAKISGR